MQTAAAFRESEIPSFMILNKVAQVDYEDDEGRFLIYHWEATGFPGGKVFDVTEHCGLSEIPWEHGMIIQDGMPVSEEQKTHEMKVLSEAAVKRGTVWHEIFPDEGDYENVVLHVPAIAFAEITEENVTLYEGKENVPRLYIDIRMNPKFTIRVGPAYWNSDFGPDDNTKRDNLYKKVCIIECNCFSIT